MFKRVLALVAAFALTLAGLASPAIATPTSQKQVAPVYTYPDWWNVGDNWERACTELEAGSILIANTGYEADGVQTGGPNTSRNTDYATSLGDCHRLGQKVIGYVSTSYASQPLAEVKEDIDAWYSYYDGTQTGAYQWSGSYWSAATSADMQIDGIFFDEVPTNPSATSNSTDNVSVNSYYRELYEYVKAKHSTRNHVMINPGTSASTNWQINPLTQVGDQVVVFEGTDTTYNSWTPPSWVTSADPNAIVIMVYSLPQSGIKCVCKKTRTNNAGFVTLTDAELTSTATPWNSFPASGYITKVRLYCP